MLNRATRVVGVAEAHGHRPAFYISSLQFPREQRKEFALRSGGQLLKVPDMLARDREQMALGTLVRFEILG